MATYDGIEMEELLPAAIEKEHVLIFQDVSTFHSNDFKGVSYWLQHGKQILKSKSRGRLIHHSGFLCARYGRLRLTPELVAANSSLPKSQRLDKTDAGVTIYPTLKAGGDNYWNAEQMISQVRWHSPSTKLLADVSVPIII